jgi:adenylate cyclase
MHRLGIAWIPMSGTPFRKLPFDIGPIGHRRIRLLTGLVLFTYVLTHLLNHALGNFSVEAMETGLVVQRWIWQGWIGTLALYLSLATHLSLGVWALYERRLGWNVVELIRLILGFLIPPLLVNHIIVTRLALGLHGIEKNYAQELYSFWIKSPFLGVNQVIVLIVVWIHGCIGLYLWLRLKPVFGRAAPLLLSGAILVPILALLGFLQGGRTILRRAEDPAWRLVELAPNHIGTAAENAHLVLIRNWAFVLMAMILCIVLLMRCERAHRERRRGLCTVSYANGREVRVPLGRTILEASVLARIPHASVCGGRARCSTCRVHLLAGEQSLPPPGAVEQALLDWVGLGPGVRLACQTRPETDVTVMPLLPPQITAADLRCGRLPRAGEECHVVILVVDMRGSTRLAESRPPYDTVFIVNHFIEAVGSAIHHAGGRPTQFKGDGLLALFGLESTAETACRQALLAAVEIGDRVAALNDALSRELREKIAFGIGIHAGNAVFGEVGYGASLILTTLGDAVNVACRLEGECKTYTCEVVLSDAVYRNSGLPQDHLPCDVIELRGRKEPISIRVAERATDFRPFVTRAG